MTAIEWRSTKVKYKKTPNSPGQPVEFCYFNCSAEATLHENFIVIITHKVVKKACTVSDVSKLYCTLMCLTVCRQLLYIQISYIPVLKCSLLFINIYSTYYPTLLRRVQITLGTSTNITQYLYSSHSPDRAKDQKPSQVRILGKWKRWIIKSLIRHFSIRHFVNFYSFVFWLALRAHQNTAYS